MRILRAVFIFIGVFGTLTIAWLIFCRIIEHMATDLYHTYPEVGKQEWMFAIIAYVIALTITILLKSGKDVPNNSLDEEFIVITRCGHGPTDEEKPLNGIS